MLSISAGLNLTESTTEFFGKAEDDFKFNFNLPNIGAVFHFKRDLYPSKKYKGGSLGISLSRVESFHLNRSYKAPNDFNSVIDSFLEGAGRTSLEDLDGFSLAAYDQFLINPDLDENDNIEGYDSFVLGFPIQSEIIKEKGSHQRLNIAWGGNYDDRFYFGAGLGIRLLEYRQQISYLESDFELPDANGATQDVLLNNVNIKENLSIYGSGLNLNLGVIYRPVPFLTAGFSYVTPTVMYLYEESFFDVDADWKKGTVITETDAEGNDVTTDLSSIAAFNSDEFVSDYELRSPSKISAGMTFLFGKSGFLSTDIERVNYGAARLKSVDFDVSSDNEVIKELYQDVVNIRLGGEYRLYNLYLRAGYSWFPSPYKDSKSERRETIAFGLGYRDPNFFLDLSSIFSNTKKLRIPYEVSFDQPSAVSEIFSGSLIITFGLNF